MSDFIPHRFNCWIIRCKFTPKTAATNRAYNKFLAYFDFFSESLSASSIDLIIVSTFFNNSAIARDVRIQGINLSPLTLRPKAYRSFIIIPKECRARLIETTSYSVALYINYCVDFPKLSRYSECGGIAALLPRGHNAGMTAWRSGWQHVSARPLRWILLLALAARLTGLALFPHYFDLGREQGDHHARHLRPQPAGDGCLWL